MPRDISGRVVAVTGGARGIGLATVRAFQDAGARVALGDVDGEAAARAAGLTGADGAQVDVTDRDAYAGWLAGIAGRLGPVDVLVSNAGIMPVGRFADEAPASVRRQVDINVHGVLTGMQLVLPAMLARGDGHLVTVASSAGRIAVPGGVTYCGTKAMVLAAAEALRLELRGTGVEVSCVLPGIVDTDLTSGLARPAWATEVRPEDVAAAIVGVVRRPRPEVWVPRALGRQAHLSALLPRRAREAASRMLGADRFLLAHDHAARAAYEARAAASEPRAETAEPRAETARS